MKSIYPEVGTRVREAIAEVFGPKAGIVDAFDEDCRSDLIVALNETPITKPQGLGLRVRVWKSESLSGSTCLNGTIEVVILDSVFKPVQRKETIPSLMPFWALPQIDLYDGDLSFWSGGADRETIDLYGRVQEFGVRLLEVSETLSKRTEKEVN